MACALVKKPEKKCPPGERFSFILDIWKELSGNISDIFMDNPTYLSEKQTADRNFALAHLMKS
jgi:glutaminase